MPTASATVGRRSIVRAWPSSTRPDSLPRLLDEQRDVGDVGGVAGHDHPPVEVGPEADAVVGGHDDQRAVVEAFGAQPVDQASEQPVDVAQLEQVALIALSGSTRDPVTSVRWTGRAGRVRPRRTTGPRAGTARGNAAGRGAGSRAVAWTRLRRCPACTARTDPGDPRVRRPGRPRSREHRRVRLHGSRRRSGPPRAGRPRDRPAATGTPRPRSGRRPGHAAGCAGTVAPESTGARDTGRWRARRR